MDVLKFNLEVAPIAMAIKILDLGCDINLINLKHVDKYMNCKNYGGGSRTGKFIQVEQFSWKFNRILKRI